MSFYTDVIQKDSRFNLATPCHDITLLEPRFRAQVLSIISQAKTMGLDLRAVETYRSSELQQHYFDKGTTRLQTVGVHHFGLAADLVVFKNGQPDWTRDYSFLSALTNSVGCIWGGDWGNPHIPHTFRDYDHVQRVRLEAQPQLFDGSWYPDDNYTAVPGVSLPPVSPDLIVKEPATPIVKTAPEDVSLAVAVAGTESPVKAQTVDRITVASARLSGAKRTAFDMAVYLNQTRFMNWFYISTVMAFIQTESNYDFGAIRREPSGVTSYGCMQVLDITAAGLGYKGFPTDMFDPRIGIDLGMMACCQNWNVLTKKLGGYPTMQQWVMAYNEGAGAVIDGRADDEYWDRWSQNLREIVGLIGQI